MTSDGTVKHINYADIVRVNTGLYHMVARQSVPGCLQPGFQALGPGCCCRKLERATLSSELPPVIYTDCDVGYKYITQSKHIRIL